MASTQLHSQRSEQCIEELCRILRNDFTSELTVAASNLPPGSNLRLRIEGRFCSAVGSSQSEDSKRDESSFLMGYIDFGNPYPTPETQPSVDDTQATSPLSLVSGKTEDDGSPVHKRRKFVGGLRLKRDQRPAGEQAATTECNTQLSQDARTSCRQARVDIRLPQRNTTKEPTVPTLEPSSADKLILGVWRQIHSNVELLPTDLTCSASVADPLFSTIDQHATLNKEAFQAINSLCLRYHNLSRSTRALEMIVQAYWVECYEARILAVKQNNPTKSSTEATMETLKEACSVFRWAIWRGYKEIKDAGGWVSIVFAGLGIYRFCKYRIGFNEGLHSRLRGLRPGFEVAADTLHPEWRQLLGAIGQPSAPLYHGHPHSWVISSNKLPLQLGLTYAHTKEEFDFQFIEESVLDTSVWGREDPRLDSSIDLEHCVECGQYQSDDIKSNQCRCFPSLYGNPRSPIPVQICRLSNGKNNGVSACVDFERGTAIGEFVGSITKNLNEVDVMMGGSSTSQYQIYQGRMGNFTRFINHSCRPNSQFQKFYWRGTERIIAVSRGVRVGNEITVDYSHHYWKDLDKICLCGESSCRYTNRARSRQ